MALDAPGSTGKDRLFVHLVWEVLLACLVTGLAVTLYGFASASFGGNSLKSMAVVAAVLLFLAVGLSATVRAGAVNLAVGPVAVASGYAFAAHSYAGYVEATLFAVGVALLAGLTLALFVCVVRVPGWAASAGLSVLIMAYFAGHHTSTIDDLDYRPQTHGGLWLAGAVALSVIGGLLCLGGGLRRGLSRYRIDGDPAGRVGAGPALLAAGILIGSCLLAAASGVLLTLHLGASTPNDGLQHTFAALGAVLLGGVSAFGRRGGILGTVLGALAVTLGTQILAVKAVSASYLWVAGAAVLLGLIVTRLVERFGRPRRYPPTVGDPESPDWPLGVGSGEAVAADDTWPGGSPYAKASSDSWSGPATATLSAPPVPPPAPGEPAGYDPRYGDDTSYGARPGETSPFRPPLGSDGPGQQGNGPDIDPWGTPPRRI
ncbi:ABC transporter permease [Longispora sp. NPDC051575]|uniref:ABC transporter permease n=1 Tax=Longispora sp. NPDC051575 TaxID=3154943 RepID=UPI0034337B9A